MRAVVQSPLAFAIFGLAAGLAGEAFAQADAAPPPDTPEEITVRGGKTLSEYRLEIEQARDEVFRLFNEANKGDDTDITCKNEQPTGSRMRQSVCRSAAENRADASTARNFLNALVLSSGGPGLAAGGEQVNAEIGTGAAQGDAARGGQDAMAKFEAEWRRLLAENPELYQAVVKYGELQNEYDMARGQTVPTDQDLRVDVTAGLPTGPQCEASTLTEYQQRNNVARVTGTVSISACPAGTAGSFTLVARVRDDAGEIKPIEFNETWQRADAQDHAFNTDYPIGDNVELMSVRVRGLKCTCAAVAQSTTQ